MKKRSKKQDVVVYQAKTGAIRLRGDYRKETIWATQAEIAKLFNVTPQNITLHLANIFKEKELNQRTTCKDFLQVQVEGNRQVKRKIKFYNLDVIIATGYRINSVIGTNFRIWATKTLREHITRGYTINRTQIARNYEAFMKAVRDIQALLPEHITIDPRTVLELVKEFSSTWMSLDAYDKESLATVGTTKRSIALSTTELMEAVANLRDELMRKGEATDMFAKERVVGSVESIVGNVMQSFGGRSVYESVEERAAHLLYFMVKNHPFIDGNKRSGALAFVWFLRKAKAKKFRAINPATLTVLTLLLAESDPKKKEQMVALITQLLR